MVLLRTKASVGAVMPDRIRIGYYDESVSYGGTTRYLTSVVRGLDRSRYKVTLFAIDDRDWHADIRALGADVITLKSRNRHDAVRPKPNILPPKKLRRLALPSGLAWSIGLASDIGQLVRLFRRTPLDLLHSNNAGAEPAPVAARLARVPRVVATWHVDPTYDLFNERQGYRYQLLESVSMRSLDYAISVSEATKRDWVQRCGLDSEYQSRITVIHNGIDVGEWQRRRSPHEAKVDLGLEADMTVIGSVGRLDHAKGYQFLLHAVAEVLPQLPRTRLVIAGSGPLEHDLRQQADALGIAHAVAFLGFVKSVRMALEAFDVYAQPSLCEAHGFGLLEAAAMGLPIIASDVGGNPETVVDGQSGYVVPARSSSTLVQPLLRVLRDPDLRLQMGRQAQQRTERLFTVNQMCAKTAAVYDRALSRC
jgi:glycosyltransferase involved in cell wall biosynthesis